MQYNKISKFKQSERVFSTREQARIIRLEALQILEKANEFASTSRRVSKRAAYKVISRSLSKTSGLPFSIRKHQAFSDLSDYIALAKHNKLNGLTAFNTDLLPVSHPRSTKVTTMTASAMLEAQMRWVIDDPRITDDTAKSLIASAMMSHPDSPEHMYTMKRIELLPQGTVPLEALVAAYGDGNSRAARSARAKLQRRDRKGRFAEMFGTFKLILGLRDGGKASATGRILGQNIFSPDLLDMELPNGRIAAVPISQGEQPDAFLDDVSPEAREKGWVRASDMDIDNNAPVVDEDSLVFMDAPSGFREDKSYKGDGKRYTDESFDVTVFDKPSPQTRDLIDAAIKRSRELDVDDPRQVKLGEDGKLWDPDRKLFAVNKRGEKTQFAFAQNWKDALAEITRKEKLDTDQEQFEQGEDEETSPLLDQLKGAPKKPSKKDEKPKAELDAFKYNVPKDSIKLDPNEEYIPEGDQDDPAKLAAMHRIEELDDALIDALEPVNEKTPATGLGRLTDENGEEYEVPAEAILSAINEQGEDVEASLAKAYDAINGNTENQDALADKRGVARKAKAAEPKELDEIFDEVVAEEPEEPIADIPTEEEIEEPVDENEEMLDALKQIPALEALSREERQSIIDNDDYSPFIPKNEDIDFPEGMYKPQESSEADKEEAVALASNRSFSDDEIIEGLNDAIKNGGSSEVLVMDENGELVPSPVSAESWRDALALRGLDQNKTLKDIANGSLDLAKEKKEAESRARKKQKDAAKKWQERRNNLRKDLGIEEGSWNEQDILSPIERAQAVFGDDPAYEKDLNDLIESYKSFLEGKDLNKYDDAEAGLRDFREVLDGVTEDDENYQKLVDAVKKSVDDSLESIAAWRKRNPAAGGDEPEKDQDKVDKVTLPETLPDGWENVDGSDNQMAVDKATGDIIGYQDREGTKPHWYIVTGLDDSSPEFPSFEDALKYWNDNYKDKERVYPEGTPAGEYDATEQGKTDEEILAEETKEEEPSVPPTEPPAEESGTGEEPPKKVITYKRAGKRTLLRGGKGAPFRDKDLADFLAENGFEWSDTVERDGKTINVKAQTAMQDDEEFKAFARELRDRFDIDLQPRAGEEPIDIDAPATEPEAPTPTPETPETPVVEETPKEEAIVEEKLKDTRKSPQDLKVGDEVYIPGVGWRRVTSISERKFDNKPSIWIVEYTDGNPYWPRTGKWKTMKGWKNSDGTEADQTLYTREPVGIPTDGTSDDMRIGGEPPEEFRTPVSGESIDDKIQILLQDRAALGDALAKIQKELPGAEPEDLIKDLEENSRLLEEAENIKRGQKSPDEFAGLPAGTRATSKDLKGRSNIWIKQEDGTWVNIKTNEIVDELPIPIKQYGGSAWWSDYEFTAPENLSGEEVADDDDSDIVDEALIDSVKEDENPNLDSLIKQIQQRKKLTRAERKALKKEKNHRQQMMIKIIDSEFGQGAFNLDFPQRAAVRQMLFDLDSLTTEEMEDISRLVNAELGWEFIKNLPDKPEGSEKKTNKPQEDPAAETYVFPPEEKPDSEATPATEEEKPAAEEKPTPLTERDKEILKALVDKRRKIQRKIDKADLSEETTPAQKKALKDELDAVTKIIDEIVLGERSAESTEKPTPDTPSTSAKPIKTSVRGADLQPGDVLTKDFFTITNVEGGYKKPIKGEEVPASRVSGYYPGSVEQSSKLWADDTMFEVYRGATPPEKGDLPELRQPRKEDFTDRKDYIKAREDYDKELERRKSTWTAPEAEVAPEPAPKPKTGAHVITDVARNLQPNDIAFTRNETTGEPEQFFVITEVVEGTKEYTRPDNGKIEKKTTVRGFYPGHEMQENDWNEETPIEVIRGESSENMPKAGDKPAIERIANGTLKGKAYQEKRAEIVAARKEAGKDYKPSITAEDIPAARVDKPKYRPDRPAFTGSAAELGKLNDGAAISEALKGKRVVIMDFETVGTGRFDHDDPDAPIQIAGAVYENGEKVDEINLFINPGVPLDNWYYKNNDKSTGEIDPAKILKSGDTDVTDEWLATQPGIAEQLKAFADWAGPDSIWVAHNAEFDVNTFEKWAAKTGVEYEISGVIDTRGLARSLYGNKGNALGQLAKKFEIEVSEEDLHNASTDISILKPILDRLLSEMKPDNPQFDTAARAEEYKAKLDKYNRDMAAWKAQEAADNVKTKPAFGPEGTTDQVNNYSHVSVFGDEINEAWMLDDENTYSVNGGSSVLVDELRVGDFIEGRGGYVEIIDIQVDPENSDKLIVYRKSPNTGEVYVDRVEDSATPGIGWARTREIKYGEVRRRHSTVGKTEAEVKSTLPKPAPDNPTPQVEPEAAPVKGEEVTDEQATKIISDAIETITSGSKSDSTVADAVKDLNVDETIKSQVIDREGGSAYHLDANGVPLKAGDRVRNIKNGRIGTVRTLMGEFGKDKRKNYLKVKFDDATKRENAAAGSLEIIREDDGDSILSPEPMPTDMGMSLPEEATTRGLIASRIDPTDLKVGDRLDISGKTRVTAIRVGDNDVSVATKTRGSRGGGFASFPKTDKVKVWRKPEDTPDIPMGMALPDMGAEVYDMAPLSEEGSAVPNALPEDNYEYAGEKFPPTAEQRNVITAIMTGDDAVVRALAGTGKTSTLTLAARRLLAEQPSKKIVYIAFNKTVQMEAEGKMPKNVESRTGDSIAFQGVSDDIRQKFLNQKGKTANMKLRAEDIADELGIKPTGVKLKGVEVSLSSREIPAIIKQAVNNFAISADDELGAKHFTEELDEVPRSFVEYANAYWDDLNSPAGVFGINNAHITKIWALSNPDLGSVGSGMKTPADVIFFDEAQDINPVIAKVIADQKIQKVYVGDGNQAIYAFRGAEDQLDKTTAKWDLPLTQSFRFGPEIAGMANRFLAQLGSKYRVEGAGGKGEVVDGMEDPDVVITRTNSGGFRAMIELLDAGKVVGITKGTKDELESLVNSASWLIGDQTKFKKPTMHPDLAEFKNWSEVKEAVEKGEGRKVKALYDLVVQNGIGSIKDILSRVKVATPESEKKDLKPSSDFKKVTLDQAEDGAKGSIGNGINYEVKGNAIRLSGNGTFKGKDSIKEQKFRWDPTGKQWYKEVEDDLDRQKAINDLRRAIGGFAPDAGEEEDEIDVIVTTAHKSKGLQWNNVRIFDDFWGPRTNKKTGELEMPVDEELRLAYVALTRAQKKLDPGPLNWIKDYTEDEDESPKKPTAVETSMGMALPTENVTEDQFNESTVKTAEKIDPATEKVANAIIEAIERGTVPWQKPWTGGGFLPTSVATGKTYEGSNILVLWAAMEKNGWTDNRFLTYKQAEKLGGNIRRGEKGTQVIHWQPVFKEVEKPDGTKEKVFVYRPPKVITLFNVEQADNINLPAIVKGEPVPVTEGETAILEAYKDKPEIIYVSQDQAFYSPIEDIIKLPQREQFKSDQSFFETLVHELAHSTGHRSRLDRSELTDNYGNHLESRGEEELIAEITVALVAARLGVKIDFENVAAYAKSWLPAVKNDPQMIVKAAKQAQKATDHMLGKQEAPEAPVDEEGNPIGSGVGSEGKTGEEISAEKKAESENNDERTV